MYVCLCNGVTDKAIRQAVRAHHPHSMKQLRHLVPIGTQCGKCIKQARAILVEEREQLPKLHDVA